MGADPVALVPPQGPTPVWDLLAQSYYRDAAHRLVWRRNTATDTFAYNDGDDVENRLLQTLSEARDLRCGSAELGIAIQDWPTKYHLSSQRANLLRPLRDFFLEDTLEIGAGCGALTRYLGELGGNVVALEGSLRRAEIAALRCRDLHNVSVVCDTLSSADIASRFETVLVVGVLEYCNRFGESPTSFLRQCRSYLKPGGRLILAIENQLGLKYFCAAPEDHTGSSYFGIEDRYNPGTAVTWGRKELLAMLESAGWRHTQQLFPFPDYKLPDIVLTENSLNLPGLICDLLNQYGSASDTGVDYLRPFSEAATWPVIARNGLLKDLANSFLIVASDRPQQAHNGIFIYSTSRQRAFQKQTRIAEHKGEIVVSRSQLYREDTPDDPNFAWIIPRAEFQQGTVYSTSLEQVFLQPGWSYEDIVRWAKPYYEFLLARVLPATRGETHLSIPGECLDCIPHNLVVQPDGTLAPFDLEWISRKPLPLKLVLFRALLICFQRMKAVAPSPTSHRFIDLITHVTAQLSCPLSAPELADFLRWESEFQSFANGFPAQLTVDILAFGSLKRRLPSTDEVNQLCGRIETLSHVLAEERRTSKERTHELECENQRLSLCRSELEEQLAVESESRRGMEQSRSWRITAPIRNGAAAFRGRLQFRRKSALKGGRSAGD